MNNPILRNDATGMAEYYSYRTGKSRKVRVIFKTVENVNLLGTNSDEMAPPRAAPLTNGL